MNEVKLEEVYAPSEEIVAREIEEEIIIIPIGSGVGDLEDELFSLNELGKEIWQRLDGAKSLRQIAEELFTQYEVEPTQLEQDIKGFIGELLTRKIVVKCPS